MTNAPIITLTTDFGTCDEYVGSVKGVMLSRAPEARIIDITHQVPPQDIRAAAHIVNRAFRYFPAATVHLVVVDPGVGSSRKIVALEAEEHIFIGPDNGVFSPLFHRGAVSASYCVDNTELFLENPSTTFHGRDIMAPVAARVAAGMALSETGERLKQEECTIFPPPVYQTTETEITGEIVHIDHFGNLCTNLTVPDLAPLLQQGAVQIKIGVTSIEGISSTYSTCTPGEPLAYFDSHGHLEIAVRNGSAALVFHAQRGDRVSVEVLER